LQDNFEGCSLPLEEQAWFELRTDANCLDNSFEQDRVIAASKWCQYNEVLASQG
jgi:hypothetical protein